MLISSFLFSGNSHRKLCKTICLSFVLVLALSACQKQIIVRGNLAETEVLDRIQPGQTTSNEVLALLGTPSTLSSFQDRTWYYIGERREKIAFLEPDVIDRKVLVLNFQNNGVVADKALYTFEDGEIINVVTRETPTAGRELTVLQQLFGNIGRFTLPEQ